MSKENVVIDIGSHTICAGLSSSTRPTVRIRSVVPGAKVDKPIIKRGLIAVEDAFEEVLNNVYKSLKVEPSNSSTLIASHPGLLRSNTEKLMVIFFETFSTPGAYISPAPLLNLYAFGRTTGFSTVFGHDVVSWMPIYEGNTIPLQVGTSYFAGSTINERMFELLSKSYPFLSPRSPTHQEIIGKIKEEHCYIAENFEVEIQLQRSEEKTHKLPDGRTIRIHDERFRAPEVLFKPSFLGNDSLGIQVLIAESIQGCPIDIRSDLRSNICVSGGTSGLPGFKERLASELKDIDNVIFEKCKVIGSDAPTESVWTGGSILASLSSFEDQWITKQEYDETGPTIAMRKCYLFSNE